MGFHFWHHYVEGFFLFPSVSLKSVNLIVNQTIHQQFLTCFIAPGSLISLTDGSIFNQMKNYIQKTAFTVLNTPLGFWGYRISKFSTISAENHSFFFPLCYTLEH